MLNKKAIQAMKDFLEALGLDLAAAGMEKTPERVAKMYELLFDGRNKDTKEVWGETISTEESGIIAIQHIPFYSMCEHHLVPFFGEVHIAYVPQAGRIAGFSKFTKLVELLSHRPQLQERLTSEIADAIEQDLGASSTMVVMEAQQLCMMMRGDLAPGIKTITTECRGGFCENKTLYAQAWMLLMKNNSCH